MAPARSSSQLINLKKTMYFSPIFSKRPFTTLLVSLIVAIDLMLMLQVYVANMGGSGFRLPQNLITLIFMAICIFIVAIKYLFFSPSTGGVRVAKVTPIWLLAFLLLSQPILWTFYGNHDVTLLPQLTAYALAMLFYLAMLQIPLSPNVKRFWLVCILIAAVAQAMLALCQLFMTGANNWMEFPADGTRVYGIFQQVNLLGSFLATGWTLALYFSFKARHGVLRLLLAAIMAVLLVILVTIQSRVAWLGASASSALLIWAFRRHRHWRQHLMIGFPIALAIVVACQTLLAYAPIAGLNKVDKTHSTAVRVKMIMHSLHMIAEHPLSGWGAGHFEHDYLLHVREETAHSLNSRPPTHPHNEILFQWVENGVIALAGMALIILAWFKPVVTGSPYARRRAFRVWTMTLPIVIHLLFEYPLYQSAPHGLVLLLLIRLMQSESDLRSLTLHPWAHYAAAGFVALFALALMVFAATGLHTNAILTQIERNRFADFSHAEQLINPYAQWERYQFDASLHRLMTFNSTKDVGQLIQFKLWAKEYLKKHHDANVTFSLLEIAILQGDMEWQQRLHQRGHQLFPEDKRFNLPVQSK
ncbi:Wzy polymerase domain-containing protein [Pantoea sp. DY-15]|uniref:PglL family O-oligosaccharyltransferase n=1 Tax=unclassified Pantoea TaxID=2630326 RepID=UPI001C965286|nr:MULTISPECIES: Wzy polymerase domain-containing protein [unclassified Pantoea]MBY4841056.1 Wzy polymerase domain-containing protein [Pantoea sp. DY-5]MBY4891078.1 Wzy polymerase domain-containing protein [Pantoea sp. DY-15]